MSWLLFLDLEATCWEKRDKKSEIIEIGVVLYNKETQDSMKLQYYVKPILNPQLSEYCIDLTKITQDKVDSANNFIENLLSLKEQVETLINCPMRKIPYISWGEFDKNQIQKDCELHSINNPFGHHYNLKELFSKHRGKSVGLSKAVKFCNLEFYGQHHSGVDDAENVKNVYVYMKEKCPHHLGEIL